ncbi:hypothetical protein E2I00_002340, partial [Balaenoptera physalus]
VETREDEEQNVKLTEILELLVAAGYFRARIKGLSPFDKDDDFIKRKEKAIKTVVDLSLPIHVGTSSNLGVFAADAYKPRRKYKRQRAAEELLDEESRIHTTLLEYGRRYGFSRQSKAEKAEDKKMALPAGLSAAEKADAREEDELQAAEEQRIQSLMTKMTAMAREESRLTASSVGQIVGLCSAEIKQIVSEYAEKCLTLCPSKGPHWLGCDRLPSSVLPRLSRDRAVLMHWGGLIKAFGSSVCFPQQSELSAEESPEKLGTSQLHRHKVISLNKQILQKTKQLEELQASHSDLQARYEEEKKTLTELKSYGEKLDKEQAALEKVEAKADPGILQNLRALVAMNENLKSQEQEFKAHCREEMARLQQDIETLKAERAPGRDGKVRAVEERSRLLGLCDFHREGVSRALTSEESGAEKDQTFLGLVL